MDVPDLRGLPVHVRREPGCPVSGVDDRIETAAQLIHNTRHRAGTANVCGQCRDLALEIAEVFGVPRLTAIVERVESVRALGRPLRSGVDTPPGLARWMLSGDRS